MSTVAPKDVNTLPETEDKATLLPDRAYAYLREAIISGKLRPGARLSEVDLASQLGVSRGPVREAIRRLAAGRLLTQAPNQSARVIELDEQSVMNVYELREAIESMAAGAAAVRMTDAEREQLDRVLTAHSENFVGSQSDSYPSGINDWDFHHLVLSGSRNELALRICAGDLRDLLALLRAGHRNIKGRGSRALQEHRWIADAIIAGHADLAQTLMAQHIRNSREGFLEQWRASRADTSRNERP